MQTPRPPGSMLWVSRRRPVTTCFTLFMAEVQVKELDSSVGVHKLLFLARPEDEEATWELWLAPNGPRSCARGSRWIFGARRRWLS